MYDMYYKRKAIDYVNESFLNEEKEDTGMRYNEPQHQILTPGTLGRTGENSNSCRNSIAVYYKAAAAKNMHDNN